jgi:hypothetical protein
MLGSLDDKQIVNWFTNTRKRFWYRHPDDPSKNELLLERVADIAAYEPTSSIQKQARTPALSPSKRKSSGKAAAASSSAAARSTSPDSSRDPSSPSAARSQRARPASGLLSPDATDEDSDYDDAKKARVHRAKRDQAKVAVTPTRAPSSRQRKVKIEQPQ